METQKQMLSEHFSLREFITSATADKYKIDNMPQPAQIYNLKVLCHHVLEPLRQYAGIPIFINSGYRSVALNRLVHGVEASQHILGQAADIHIRNAQEANDFFDFILLHCTFDQLLFEHTVSGMKWLHVSCKPHINDNRKMARRNYLRAVL